MTDVIAFTRNVTTGPLPASRQVHVPGSTYDDLRVAIREIDQTGDTEPPVRGADPAGPYTDPDARTGPASGLVRPRERLPEDAIHTPPQGQQPTAGVTGRGAVKRLGRAVCRSNAAPIVGQCRNDIHS